MLDDSKIQNNNISKILESKLILLYLIDKMDIPLSNSQVCQFVLEGSYMDYFSIQNYLAEMVETKYLDITKEDNNTRYTINDSGLQALSFFEKNIPTGVKNKINEYVLDNRKRIKRDFEVTANYFYDHKTNEYIVKCGVYEDAKVLMELNISVVSKEQAKTMICNWKKNVTSLYLEIFSNLAKEDLTKD